MYPRSAEAGGETLVLSQVGQGVSAELHWLPREPAAELVDALLHPSRTRFELLSKSACCTPPI